MSKNSFHRLLENPDNIEDKDLAYLKEIINHFPFFTSARILQLKAMHNTEHFDYNSNLKTTSIFAHDRNKLFDFIHQSADETNIKDFLIEDLRVTQTNNHQTESYNEHEPDEAHVNEPAESNTQTETFSNEYLQELINKRLKEVNLEHKSLEIAETENYVSDIEMEVLIEEAQNDEILPEEKTDFERDEKLVEVEADSSNDAGSGKLVEPDAEIPLADESKTEFVEALVITQLENSTNFSEAQKESTLDALEIPLEIEEPKKEEPEKGIENTVTETLSEQKQSKTFFDWLKTIEKKAADLPEPELTSELPEKPDNIQESIDADESDSAFIGENFHLTEDPSSESDNKEIEQSKTENEKDENENQKNLIESFLDASPRIEIKKTEFYSPVNMARKSLVLDEEILSETLADIYLKQALYDKAEMAYKKLSLKFPEKKVFFAARIQKIKELKKSSK